MAFTFPTYVSKLSQPVITNNFTPCQSAQRTVSTSSSSVTFTAVQGAQTRMTYKITNTGTVGCYVSVSNSAAIVPAVLISSTPTPASGTAISTCDYVAAGAIITQDYPPLYDTVSAIVATGSTTLEISIGYGQ